MVVRRRRTLLGLAVAMLAAALVHGHGRLHFEGRVARWLDPRALEFALDPAGSDDVAGEGELEALRRAFASWSAIPGAAIAFREVAAPAHARWQRLEHHGVRFDEDGSSGWFPEGSGIVAVTPILVSTRPDPASGDLAILDADVLLNGREFHFATDGRAGAFDVQAVATHEIGHWLGFDHSACAAATMFPFVAPGETSKRSLFSDDEALARAVYPAAAAHACASGTLERRDRTRVAGAHVVAVDGEGKPVASSCSDRDGRYEIGGLAPGSYGLYADPLDGLVSGPELSLGFDPQLDFARTWLVAPGTLVLASGVRRDLGTHTVARPSSLGVDDLNGSLPRVVRGSATSFDVVARGRALELGSELELWGGGCVPDGVTRAYGSTIARRFRALEGAALGARDLVVRDPSGIEAVLTSALEIVAPAPLVERLEPSRGTLAGGELATLHGRFLGEIAHASAGGTPCEIVARGASSLLLRMPAGSAGFADLEIARADGESARLADAWLRGGAPAIEQLFPRAGCELGGTLVALSGGPFAARLRASVDGFAIEASRIDANTLHVRMPPHARGVAEIVLEDPIDPLGALRAAFDYVEAPDPVLSSLSPDRGPMQGGSWIEAQGSGFAAGARLFLGEAEALDVEVLSSNLLRARTPALSSLGVLGARLELANGQGAAKSAAFVAGETLVEGEKHLATWSGGEPVVHYAEWARGERIDLELAVERDASFEPVLEIASESGVPLLEIEAHGDRVLRVRGFEVASTQVHRLRVRGATAFAGSYAIAWRSDTRALQRKIGGTAEGSSTNTRTIAIELDGRSGLALDAELRWRAHLRAEAVRLLGPSGEIELDASAKRQLFSAPGHVRLRRVALPEAGTYRLEVDVPLEPGARWAGTLRLH